MVTTNILFPIITAEHIMTSREQQLAVQPGINRASIVAKARRQRYDLVPVLDAS